MAFFIIRCCLISTTYMLIEGLGDAIEYRIVEGQPADTLVGNIPVDAGLHTMYTAQTLTSFRYRVLPTDDEQDEARQQFSVDWIGGLLTTSKTVDRERLCPTTATTDVDDVCTIQLDVSVTPVKYFRVVRVRIHVEDLNDNAPRFPVASVTVSVYELAATGARFPLPVAVDEDSPPNGVRRYSLKTREEPSPFRLERSPLAGDLYLVLTGQLDRETLANYSLTLSALDGGTPQHSATMTVRVQVLDANDNAPTFARPVHEVAIREDAPLGTTVTTVSASDQDSDDNARVQYRRMTSRAGRPTSAPFDVDRDTGDIVLAFPLDREKAAEHVVGVVAYDSPSYGPPLSAYTRVVVSVLDANDHAPAVSVHSLRSREGRHQHFAVSENSPVGSFVAHIAVSDRDSGPNGLVSCLMSRGTEAFQLIKLPGIAEYKLVSGYVLDRERQNMYNVVVTCSDAGSPPLTSERELVVEVTDENDCRPLFTTDTYSVTVLENSRPGLSVFQLTAVDADLQESPNSRLIYSVRPTTVGQRSALSVDSANGTIYSLVSFDYESLDQLLAIDYVVTASDAGSPVALSSSTTLRLVVADVNDNPPIFVSEQYEFHVPENRLPGLRVGSVSARDCDEAPYNRVMYRLTADVRGAFNIDRQSGVIVTAIELDREQVDSITFAVIAENDITTSDEAAGSLSASANVTVFITDVNDHRPIILVPSSNAANTSDIVMDDFDVCSRARPGDRLLRVTASDMDVSLNARLRYSLQDKLSDVSGNNPTSPYVSINADDGWIVARQDLSGLVNDQFLVTVIVSDSGHPQLSTNKTLLLTVSDDGCVAAAASSSSIDARLFSNASRLTVVVVFALFVMLLLVFLTIFLLVLKCRRRRRRFDGKLDIDAGDSVVAERRWTKADGAEELAAKQHLNVGGGAEKTTTLCYCPPEDVYKCSTGSARSCFNIQHEFEVVWKSSSPCHRQQVSDASSLTQ